MTKAEIVQVGTFATDGRPVAWRWTEPLTIGVTKGGKALYCGWTVEELQAYRSFHCDRERFARDADE